MSIPKSDRWFEEGRTRVDSLPDGRPFVVAPTESGGVNNMSKNKRLERNKTVACIRTTSAKEVIF